MGEVSEASELGTLPSDDANRTRDAASSDVDVTLSASAFAHVMMRSSQQALERSQSAMHGSSAQLPGGLARSSTCQRTAAIYSHHL